MFKNEHFSLKFFIENSKFQKLFTAVLFSVFTIVAFNIAGDYGVPWDDHLQQKVGEQNYRLVTEGDMDIYSSPDQFYGSAFELPLYFIQSFFSDYSTQIYVRHIVTNLFFVLSLLFFHKLIFELLKSYWIAILGVLVIYLTPRIFANSFFNTKDIPFMAAFIISIFTMYNLLQKTGNIKFVIIHALTSAFIIDIRIIGILIPALTIFLALFQHFTIKKSGSIYKQLLIYSVVTAVLILMLWPALWYHPFIFFRSILRMSQFPWNYFNLLTGNQILATQIPFYYIPLWISVSIPIFVSLSYLVGITLASINFFKSFDKNLNIKSLLLLVLILLPIDLCILFVLLDSTFYDGWRHLYFMYPMIITGGLYGLKYFYNYYDVKLVKVLIVVLILAFMSKNVITNVKLHPYQQVYFNALVDKSNNALLANWEMDYWGLSFKEGFEKILELDSSKQIRVNISNESAIDNWRLSQEIDDRIILVDSIFNAKYFISNYRFHNVEYKFYKIDSIQRQGSSILGIYKLRE